MAQKRIYIITPKQMNGDALEPTDVRLVRAGSQAAALKHISDELNVAFAAQDDLAEWLPRGVKVETAGENAANPSTV